MKNIMNVIARALFALALVAAAGSAIAADTIRVAIGQKGLWDTMVVSQGIAAGFFKKEGLDVEVTWTRGGAETMQALITGSSDIDVGGGILGALGAYSKGAPVRIVSAEFHGASDLYWYVRADSPIKSMKDMDGKTMAYSRPGSSSQLVALSIASAAGVKPKLVSAGGIPDNRTQVMSGQIDAGFAIPPFNLDLVAQGKIRIIARGTDVPSLAAQTGRVNLASSKFLTERRDVARRFMKAYFDTVDWMYANPNESIAFFAKFNDVTPEIARQTFEAYPKNTVVPIPIIGLQRSLDQALEYKQIDKPMTVGQAEAMIDLVYQPVRK